MSHYGPTSKYNHVWLCPSECQNTLHHPKGFFWRSANIIAMLVSSWTLIIDDKWTPQHPALTHPLNRASRGRSPNIVNFGIKWKLLMRIWSTDDQNGSCSHPFQTRSLEEVIMGQIPNLPVVCLVSNWRMRTSATDHIYGTCVCLNVFPSSKMTSRAKLCIGTSVVIFS